MSINGTEMVTDRTLYDVKFAKNCFRKGFSNMTEEEKNNFLQGLKGAYNHIDVNRVEQVCGFIHNELFEFPKELKHISKNLGVYWDDNFDMQYDQKRIPQIETKSNWQIGELWLASDRTRFINNVETILSVLNMVDFLPFKSELQKFSIEDANNIEKNLEFFWDILKETFESKKKLINNTKLAWNYSNEIQTGELI